MHSIVEFLNDRYDELAGRAQVAEEADLQWLADYGDDVGFPRAATFIRTMTPPVVLADIEAKRQIIAECVGVIDDADLDEASDRAMVASMRGILRFLAAPFAHHPDFDPDWRVG